MKIPTVLIAALAMLLGACLSSSSGTVAADADAEDTAEAHTLAPADTALTDTLVPDTGDEALTTDSHVVPDRFPVGQWQFETIGACIHGFERLDLDAMGTYLWTSLDDNYCSGPSPPQYSRGVAHTPTDHVVDLFALETLGRTQDVTWTWTIVPGDPRVLHTSAFIRTPGTLTWVRTDRATSVDEYGTSVRSYDLAVTFDAFPQATQLSVTLDLSHTFGDAATDRIARGTLTLDATHVVLDDGRQLIATPEFLEAGGGFRHYAFSQWVRERYEGHGADLVTQSFIPVFFLNPGDDAALYMPGGGISFTERAAP